jgi:hypothetical protein
MNGVAGVLLFLLTFLHFKPVLYIIIPVSLFLIGIHILRFGLDLLLTFKFYYPAEDFVPDAAQETEVAA